MEQPADGLDLEAFRETLRRFAASLEAHRDELDSLNVFPVPDGDTGTNLLLTQRAVMEEVDALEDPTPAAFAEAVTHASLLGARGNSGVILAQVLRALTERWSAAEPGRRGGVVLAEALRKAATEARRAVARPVDGTVLTVLADAASAAREAAAEGDPATVAVAARDGASSSLRRTPEILPELAAAGVVDAGGLGTLLLLDALASVLTGTDLTVEVGSPGPVGSAGSPDQELAFKFEVMCLVRMDEADVAGVRERLAGIGDSVVVVGSGGRYKVHVHTDDPDAALAVAADAGEPGDVAVVDLEEQVAAQCVAGQARAVRLGERSVIAMVAVVEGAGLADLFRSLGALVVPGGGAPTVGELVAVIEDAAADSVVVVASGTATEAAERAAGESGVDVWVVTAETPVEGLAAAAAFNPTAAPEEALERMSEASAAVVTASLSRGSAGWVGMASGEVASAGADVADVTDAAVALVDRVRTEAHELLTILSGARADPDEAVRLSESLGSAFPGLQIESHRGDQPDPEYLFGLE